MLLSSCSPLLYEAKQKNETVFISTLQLHFFFFSEQPTLQLHYVIDLLHFRIRTHISYLLYYMNKCRCTLGFGDNDAHME